MANYLCSERLRQSKTDGERQNKEAFDKRTNIDSDFGRLVFSSAVRRLHDKTQVFPLTNNDNLHSRLTHSLEVMTIGRSFTVDLMSHKEFTKAFKPDDMSELMLYRQLESLLSTICLAHDIGNPPFGHFGETTIQNYFSKLFDDLRLALKDSNLNHPIIYGILHTIDNDKNINEEDKQKEKDNCLTQLKTFLQEDNPELLDFTSFDGNAQGFRVLTKNQFLNDLYGLNLTYASLASFLKYPNIGKPDKHDKIALHKHGVFTTEKDAMKKVMDGCGIKSLNDNSYNRHPLSFIMEACDTICYLVMDMEDAANKGWITFEMIEDLANGLPKNRDEISEAESNQQKNKEKPNKKLQEVLKNCYKHFSADDPKRKKIVQLRVDLINYLVKYAIDRFIKNLSAILDGQFKEELLFNEKDPDCLAECLSKFSVKEIYSKREIESLELTGDAVISGLIDHYIKYLFSGEKSYRLRGRDMISHASFYTTLQEHLDSLNNGKKAWVEYDKFDPSRLSFGERIRIIRDYVSGMTDKFALQQYQKLNGQKI